MRRERVPQRLTAGQRQDREYQTPPSHPLSLTVRALQNRGEGPHETGTDGLPAEPAQPQRERYGTPHLRLELHGVERRRQPGEARVRVPPKRQPRFVTLDENRLQSHLGAERAELGHEEQPLRRVRERDRKSTRLNSSHGYISYAVFCLNK